MVRLVFIGLVGKLPHFEGRRGWLPDLKPNNTVGQVSALGQKGEGQPCSENSLSIAKKV